MKSLEEKLFKDIANAYNYILGFTGDDYKSYKELVFGEDLLKYKFKGAMKEMDFENIEDVIDFYNEFRDGFIKILVEYFSNLNIPTEDRWRIFVKVDHIKVDCQKDSASLNSDYFFYIEEGEYTEDEISEKKEEAMSNFVEQYK